MLCIVGGVCVHAVCTFMCEGAFECKRYVLIRLYVKCFEPCFDAGERRYINITYYFITETVKGLYQLCIVT